MFPLLTEQVNAGSDRVIVYLDIMLAYVIWLLYDALLDLFAFVQFQKCEKTHGGVFLVVLKITLLHVFFLRFLNCTNGTKSYEASHIPC